MKHDHPTPAWQDVVHDEQKKRQRLETKDRSVDIDDAYYAAKAEALSHFINGDGANVYSQLFEKYKCFHAEAGSKHPDQDALRSARAKIEEEHLMFMSLAEWRERSF